MPSDDHYGEFRRTRLVRLPGAVTAKDVEAMVDRIWRHLGRSHGIVRERPETWTAEQPTGLGAVTAHRPPGLGAVPAAPEFKALGSGALSAAVDDLIGIGRWHPPRRWGRP